VKKKIIVRADGNPLIGFGHIYRMLALADMLKDEFYIVFVLFPTAEFILNEIKNYSDEVILLPGALPFKTADEIRDTETIPFDLANILQGDEIVVLDGYYFGDNYQQAVKEKGCRLVCIDDLASRHFFADVVMNHAPGIDHLFYIKENYTRLYTGLDYAILRQPFLKPFNIKKNGFSKAFISLGGADHFGYSEKLLNSILQLDIFDNVQVLCSSSFNDELLNTLKKTKGESGKVQLHFDLNAEQLVEVMDNCTHAFVAASTVLLETYARGLTCFAGFYTRNQQFIYDGFVKNKWAGGLGNFKSLDVNSIHRVYKMEIEIEPLKFPLQSAKNIHSLFNNL